MKLGKEQEEALQNIKDFLISKNTSFSLIGPAGTGKSLLIKYIVNYLEEKGIDYVLCAPTHKAKLVLELFTQRSGITIHKLLSLAPNLEILELDFRDLKFLMNKNLSEFPSKGVILCDESSMINDELFKALEEKAILLNSKLIFVGDEKQLKPVKSEYKSKVFTIDNKFTLNTIYRQSFESGLTNTLVTLRDDIINTFEQSLGSEGSLYCYNDIKEFIKTSLPYFKKAIKDSNILETKLLAYTNERVRGYNSKIKEILFGNEKEYNKSEFLTCYENFEFGGTKFWNSMDYIINDAPQEIDIYIPGLMHLPGYELSLYDSANKITTPIKILKKDIPKECLDSLSEFMESIRLEAIDLKAKRSRYAGKKWGDYYNITKSFTTPIDILYNGRVIRKKSFDYGYASTIHKSQGSSINNVFIDIRNVSICSDKEELRQLQYVAVSRTRNNVYIFQ